MRISSSQIHNQNIALPVIRFQEQKLTSFAGLMIFIAMFQKLNLLQKLKKCFRHIMPSSAYKLHSIALLLIVNLLLGFRRLRDIEYYKEDPLVLRCLQLNKMPDVSTISRSFYLPNEKGYEKLRTFSNDLLLNQLEPFMPMRLTVDFDGSVLWTKSRNTEGTAIGFNKAKKGARSYYPFFATVAQCACVLDMLHRPGNVHDSNAATRFVEQTFINLRSRFPICKLEARLDSAHFSKESCFMLDDIHVEFTVSVAFERLAELKNIIEQRKRWRRINKNWSYFEMYWQPKSWSRSFRFIFYRQRVLVPRKDPIQLDLFLPRQTDFEFKVVVTNKTAGAKKILAFHNGRGEQEGIFAELKSQLQMDYLPSRKLLGNKMFTLCAVIAHNLSRILQMLTRPMIRGTCEKRSPQWIFEEIRTIRHRIIQRAGLLTKPQGRLTLTMNANEEVKKEVYLYLTALGFAHLVAN